MASPGVQGLIEAEERYVKRLRALLSVYHEPLALVKLCSKNTLKVPSTAAAAARRMGEDDRRLMFSGCASCWLFCL
jgi:hypothetical protein